jgi:hypothetical protein
MSDCFNLYENINYGGHVARRCAHQAQNNCKGDNIGRCNIMPCAADVTDKCWGFGDETSSLKVDEGVLLKLYQDVDYGGSVWEYRGDHPKLDYANDKPSSWEAKKDCEHSKWLWDDDCFNKKSFTINNSNMNQKRNDYCNKQNLNNNSQCKNWCFQENNKKDCKDALQNYCNDENNVTKPECKIWCKQSGNGGKCDSAVVSYCNNHLEDSNFCSCFDDNMRQIVPDSLQDTLFGGSANYGTNNRAICWSKLCGIEGYKTLSMLESSNTCPACYMVSANNEIDINNIDKSKISANFLQNCSNGQIVNSTTNSNTATDSTTPTDSNTPTNSNTTNIIDNINNYISTIDKNILYFLAFFILFIIIYPSLNKNSTNKNKIIYNKDF